MAKKITTSEANKAKKLLDQYAKQKGKKKTITTARAKMCRNTLATYAQQQTKKAVKKGVKKAGKAVKKGYKKAARKIKRKLPPALKRWNAHLSTVRKANPNLNLARAMIKAKGTYKK